MTSKMSNRLSKIVELLEEAIGQRTFRVDSSSPYSRIGQRKLSKEFTSSVMLHAMVQSIMVVGVVMTIPMDHPMV